MLELNSVFLGLLLLILGSGFFLLTLVILRVIPRIGPQPRNTAPKNIPLPLAGHDEAVLLVQAGGRVAYINESARKLFNLWEEGPNLESLARMARPSESFLSLCAREGHARLSLNGHIVEGTSYLAPQESENAILIALHYPMKEVESGDPAGAPLISSSQTYQLFDELNTLELHQSITAHLDLHPVLQAILTGVEQLIPSDFLEVTVWEPESDAQATQPDPQTLRGVLVPYRLVGLPGVDRRLEKAAERYRPDHGYAGRLIAHRAPLNIRDISAFREAAPALDRRCYPFQSYLGCPLFIAGDLVGTLEMASLSKEAFSPGDLETLRALSTQAALAIRNALLDQTGRERAMKLARLCDLAHSLSRLSDPTDLFARLIESISPLLEVEILGFLVYDEELLILEAKPPFLGIQPNAVSLYQVFVPPESPAAEVMNSSETIVAANAPADPRLRALGLDQMAQAAGIQHTALVPLAAGGHVLGYLQAGDKQDGKPFNPDDLRWLTIIAGHASAVIERLRLAAQNTPAASSAETGTPVSLVQTVETQNFASLPLPAGRLTEGLELARIEIAEILNEQLNRMELVQCFSQEILSRLGLFAALTAEPTAGGVRLLFSQGSIPAGLKPETLLGQRNPLRHSLQSGETLLVSNLETDPDWQNTPLLSALGAQAFICLPIFVKHRPDSAILAVSTAPLPPFTTEDERLFGLLIGQAALALHNLQLSEETNRRLREANLLLDFSFQLGSLDPASIQQTLVNTALHVIPSAQSALVALWDSNQNCLVPQAAAGFKNNSRLMEIRFEKGEAVPGQVFETGESQVLEEVQFARQYNLRSENLILYRDASGGRLPVSSLAILITTLASPLGVLELDNFETAGAFSEEDLAVATSLSQQTALILENARLFQASEQRARQLQALTDLAAVITSSLQPDELVAGLLAHLEPILPYDTGTLWLRESMDAGKDGVMTVRAAHGFDDSDQRLGLSVALADSSLLNEMLKTGRPILVPNVLLDQRFPSIIPFQRLSWLGVPLIASGAVIGVIALEKIEANFYRIEHIQAATTFAGQAAVALENAGLYQESVRRTEELDSRSQRLAMLNHLSGVLGSTLDESQILEFTLQELSQATRSTSISAILFDPSGAFLRAELPSTGLKLPLRLPDAPLFERIHQSRGVYNTEDILREPDLAPIGDFLACHATRGLLILPLATGGNDDSSENRLHGLLLAHQREPGCFNPDEVEVALTIGNQAAIAIQNARLFSQTRSLTEDLEHRVQERTAQLAREHHRSETLLHIITELSGSLDLEQVLNRTLRALNGLIDAEQITILIVRPDEKNLHRLASMGSMGPGKEAEGTLPFTIDHGLAGWVIRHRQSALIEDVLEDPRWARVPEGPSPQRGALAVPLMIGAEALGALLLFHSKTAHFSDDQLDLVQAVANQVAVAVNNAELYRLIRDQADELGGMLRSQRVETSRSQAILESVADGVLVTDANKVITLFNASAEAILGLSRTSVVGKSLEHFAGLFGKATQSWWEAINTWYLDPKNIASSGTYTEQVSLKNGRVAAVRLAPVSLGKEFLGTVSIFQDVTHQVEVDRLKSEFVATVSHELRTPMTSIKGYVEILLMGAAGPVGDQQMRFLEIVKNNTERLAILVNDLLDISRIETGQASLSLQPLCLADLVEGALTDLSRRVLEENKQIILEKDFPADLPPALGDRDRVRQILDNLLDNAYQYNSPGGAIRVRLRAADAAVQVDVQDTGQGIPLLEQPRVFERFFRGESPLRLGVSGTGLGLSIVQNLVEMHGGRLWFESTGRPGEGCIFSFTLPIVRPDP